MPRLEQNRTEPWVKGLPMPLVRRGARNELHGACCFYALFQGVPERPDAYALRQQTPPPTAPAHGVHPFALAAAIWLHILSGDLSLDLGKLLLNYLICTLHCGPRSAEKSITENNRSGWRWTTRPCSDCLQYKSLTDCCQHHATLQIDRSGWLIDSYDTRTTDKLY